MIVFDNQGSSTVKYMKDSPLQMVQTSVRTFLPKKKQRGFRSGKKRKNALGVIGVTWLNSDLDGTTTNEQTIKERVEELNKEEVTELAGDEKKQNS